MSKNIIIAGASRSGKTSLATRLNQELNYFVISQDRIVAMFGRAYPQLDIRFHWQMDDEDDWDYGTTRDNLAPLLGHFLGVFSDFKYVTDDEFRARAIKGNRFVMEGAFYNFDIISSILDKYEIEELNEHFILIGLVQNKKTADDFVRDFKKYDTEDDWTYNWSDEDLRDYAVERAIPFNREMTDLLMKYGFTIYDTSTEREQIFDKIIEDVKSKLA